MDSEELFAVANELNNVGYELIRDGKYMESAEIMTFAVDIMFIAINIQKEGGKNKTSSSSSVDNILDTLHTTILKKNNMYDSYKNLNNKKEKEADLKNKSKDHSNQAEQNYQSEKNTTSPCQKLQPLSLKKTKVEGIEKKDEFPIMFSQPIAILYNENHIHTTADATTRTAIIDDDEYLLCISILYNAALANQLYSYIKRGDVSIVSEYSNGNGNNNNSTDGMAIFLLQQSLRYYYMVYELLMDKTEANPSRRNITSRNHDSNNPHRNDISDNSLITAIAPAATIGSGSPFIDNDDSINNYHDSSAWSYDNTASSSSSSSHMMILSNVLNNLSIIHYQLDQRNLSKIRMEHLSALLFFIDCCSTTQRTSSSVTTTAIMTHLKKEEEENRDMMISGFHQNLSLFGIINYSLLHESLAPAA